MHAPIGLYGVRLLVRVRRCECCDCECSRPDGISSICRDDRIPTHAACRRAITSVVLDARSILSCARQLYCSWDTVNELVLTQARAALPADVHRLDGVTTPGVDGHVWRHTGKEERYVTVIVDLSPRQNGRTARLLDMVKGRSEKAFATWLSGQSDQFRDGIRVVEMDAFAGCRKAAGRVVPRATEALDPFHIVALPGEKVTQARCRLHQETTGGRGTRHDPPHRGRRALWKTAGLRADRQQERVSHLLSIGMNAPLKLMHGVCRKIIGCYKQKDRRRDRGMMAEFIESLNVPGAIMNCPELKTLARTSKRRMKDILAFFDHQYSANGPAEATNGRLEHPRGIASGFRTLSNYTTRSLLHAEGSKTLTHTQM